MKRVNYNSFVSMTGQRSMTHVFAHNMFGISHRMSTFPIVVTPCLAPCDNDCSKYFCSFSLIFLQFWSFIPIFANVIANGNERN